jgi:hypothetical protein
MARGLIAKNKIINENWMDTARGNADCRMSCSSVPYWRKAPIGGYLDNNLLELFFLFANISLKHNIKAIGEGYFLLQYVILYMKMGINGSICGEKRNYQLRITFG